MLLLCDTSVDVIVYDVTVLPSTGIGSLSAREAEGRSNISAGEKVILYQIFSYHSVLISQDFYIWIYTSAHS